MEKEIDDEYMLGQIFVRKYDLILFHDVKNVTVPVADGGMPNGVEQRFYSTIYIREPETVASIWGNFIAYMISIIFLILLTIWLYQKKIIRFTLEKEFYLHIEQTLREVEEDGKKKDPREKKGIDKQLKMEL